MRSFHFSLVVSPIALVVVVLLQATVLSHESAPASGNPTETLPHEQRDLGEVDPPATPCAEILSFVISDSLMASRYVVLEMPGDSVMFSLAELAAFPRCLEGPGGFTTSAGSSVTGQWAGVSLPDLLIQWAGLEDDHAVTFVADDGYRMTFEGAEILDRSEGTWILAMIRDAAPLPTTMGPLRAIKVGPSAPMITGHVSVARVHRIVTTGIAPESWSLTMQGRMHVDVDRQTVQSCVSCHEATVRVGSEETNTAYRGVAFYRMLAFSDDSLYAPHHQDSSIPSYRSDLARTGYTVTVGDTEGKTLSFDSRNLDHNDAAILGLYRDGESLPGGEAPLVLVVSPGEKGAGSSELPAIFPRVTSVTLQLP